ncbi:acyloxyacyl hydrolase isoform X2 [Patella vulgata]|uniref:acyloxyacyl hydrolase isoform X2 n=1 Tax=Patella vulgata TaxID=6465 RepID=UPI00218048A8|nr:acyloxyacyl hydrolase isoform X2 [Patella vulgata]
MYDKMYITNCSIISWKFTSVFLIILYISSSESNPISHFTVASGVNGGSNCAGCTVVVSLIEQLGEIHNETVVKALDRLCSYLPPKIKGPCQVFAQFIGPILVELVTQDANPDTVCQTLRFCNTNGGPECLLYKKDEFQVNDMKQKPKNLNLMMKHSYFLSADPKICEIPGIKDICKLLDDAFRYHDPSVDIDGDKYSTAETFRGTSWRGRDCNDDDKYTHPGSRPIDYDATDDSNCNGIYGSDPATTKPYEEEFCANSQARGIAVLGDSLSAHFHLPEEWFDATKLSEAVLKDALFIIENEIDWPELSTVTGHVNNSWPEVVHGSMDSIYQRLFERNHCNHGDYQNIAVNGADTGEMVTNIMYSLSRNQTLDIPILVTYALVGNDVCNGHPDTFAHMTTVEDMKANSLKTLQYLDTILPNNSYVMVMGLADGRVLYDNLHDRIHPLGRLRNDITYTMIYDYLNCLQISPCTGWMNSNGTVRNLTTEHAETLSTALQQVVQQYGKTFKNFKIQYIDCPLTEVFDVWTKSGGQAWQLIEPVDGFHSNQMGQALTAQIMWDNMVKLYPDFIGPVNPFNKQIEEIFGNQMRSV